MRGCPQLLVPPGWFVPSVGCSVVPSPWRTASGSCRVSCSPPSGILHSRILASSPAVHHKGWAVVTGVIWHAWSWGTLRAQPGRAGTHVPTARRRGSKGSQVRSATAVPFWMVGTATSGRRPGLESCGTEAGVTSRAHTVLCRPPDPSGYLEDGDLAAGGEQGQGHALVVGTEAVALARRGEAEPPQVGDVVVPVQHPALRVPEAGAGPWSG